VEETAAAPGPVPPVAVEVLWRPGCGYCARLRRGLRRAGIATEEHDIWADPAAAARVRAATGGSETVPTVFVGERALVNPTVGEVAAALRARFPEHADTLAAVPVGRSGWAGAGWTVAVALVWVALALWQPTTTWHLAPLLLAAAWPWVSGQDLRAGDRRAIPGLIGAGVAGFAGSALTALGLSQAGLLRGPLVLGSLGGESALGEAVILAAAAATFAVAVGLLRVRRRARAASAWVGDRQIAVSDDVVVVEGNAYFPLDAVPAALLTPSRTRTVCPWKGIARYYTVTVDEVVLTDAAWSYPAPLPFARRIKGRIAFWGGVEIRPATAPTRNAPSR